MLIIFIGCVKVHLLFREQPCHGHAQPNLQQPSTESDFNLTSSKHKKHYQVGSHNTSASVCPSCCSISHYETIEGTHSKWFQWFMEQCCVNADLQLPTQQREGVQRKPWFNHAEKWKVPALRSFS